MACLWILALCANVAIVNAHGAAPAPGPDLDAWKKTQADQKAADAAVAARAAKMAAVNKVVSMLESLTTKVLGEGEEEAATYNKFACFCKDTTIEKTADIDREQRNSNTLSGDIYTLGNGRKTDDTNIDTVEGKIKKAEGEKAANLKRFNKDKKAYERDKTDLEAALYGLEGAIKELKASDLNKSPSLVQLQNLREKVRPAAMLADAMGLGNAASRRAAAVFLQQGPDVPMENYKFHSDDIIATLEKLLDDFRSELKTLGDTFLTRTLKDHEAYQQLKHDLIAELNVELKGHQKARDQKIADIEAATAELSTSHAQLLDDQKYMTALHKMCKDTADTYDQRSRVRADEISALTATTGVLKGSVKGNTTANTIRFVQQTSSVNRADAVAQSKDAMETLESIAEDADAAAGVPAFLQENQRKSLRGVAAHKAPQLDNVGRNMVAELLENKGRVLKSTLLTALANQIKASGSDPFEKIKILIQELIQRLQHEAGKEADQKGWCTKATADAEQKREYAFDEVMELNAQLAELEATQTKLVAEIRAIQHEQAALRLEVNETVTDRNEEKAENQETVATAEAGLDAIDQAIDIMTKFYLTAAKEKVTFSTLQAPEDDAPDAGFGIGEEYTGDQSTQGGIVGMLEVIQSDFQRTIKETEHAEKKAEKDHLDFMTRTGVSLAEKEVAHKEKSRYLLNADNKHVEAWNNLDAQNSILHTSLQELIELKKTCIDTGMTYEERVARREDEIAALNKASCILEAYAKYGADGVGEQC